MLTDGSQTFDPEGVFVWLSGFDVSSRTNASGDFAITLPPVAAQPGQGLSGLFTLYFYVDNFRLDSMGVAVSGGEFVYDNDAVGADGSLRRARELVQAFRITTSTMPDSIEIDEVPSLISATFALRARNSPVDVFFPRRVDEMSGPVLIRDNRTGNTIVVPSTITGTGGLDSVVTVGTGSDYERIVAIPTAPFADFPVGTYEFIPFLYTASNPLPAAFIANMGPTLRELGEDYLNLPMVRRGGNFTYLPDSGN